MAWLIPRVGSDYVRDMNINQIKGTNIQDNVAKFNDLLNSISAEKRREEMHPLDLAFMEARNRNLNIAGDTALEDLDYKKKTNTYTLENLDGRRRYFKETYGDNRPEGYMNAYRNDLINQRELELALRGYPSNFDPNSIYNFSSNNYGNTPTQSNQENISNTITPGNATTVPKKRNLEYDAFNKYFNLANIDPKDRPAIMGIIERESRGNSTAKNPYSSAYGLTQILKGNINTLAQRDPSLDINKYYAGDPVEQLKFTKALYDDVGRSLGMKYKDNYAAKDLAWFLGSPTALKLLESNNPYQKITDIFPANESIFKNHKNMFSHKDGSVMTVKEFLDDYMGKSKSRTEAYSNFSNFQMTPEDQEAMSVKVLEDKLKNPYDVDGATLDYLVANNWNNDTSSFELNPNRITNTMKLSQDYDHNLNKELSKQIFNEDLDRNTNDLINLQNNPYANTPLYENDLAKAQEIVNLSGIVQQLPEQLQNIDTKVNTGDSDALVLYSNGNDVIAVPRKDIDNTDKTLQNTIFNEHKGYKKIGDISTNVEPSLIADKLGKTVNIYDKKADPLLKQSFKTFTSVNDKSNLATILAEKYVDLTPGTPKYDVYRKDLDAFSSAVFPGAETTPFTINKDTPKNIGLKREIAFSLLASIYGDRLNGYLAQNEELRDGFSSYIKNPTTTNFRKLKTQGKFKGLAGKEADLFEALVTAMDNIDEKYLKNYPVAMQNSNYIPIGAKRDGKGNITKKSFSMIDVSPILNDKKFIDLMSASVEKIKNKAINDNVQKGPMTVEEIERMKDEFNNLALINSVNPQGYMTRELGYPEDEVADLLKHLNN